MDFLLLASKRRCFQESIQAPMPVFYSREVMQGQPHISFLCGRIELSLSPSRTSTCHFSHRCLTPFVEPREHPPGLKRHNELPLTPADQRRTTTTPRTAPRSARLRSLTLPQPPTCIPGLGAVRLSSLPIRFPTSSNATAVFTPSAERHHNVSIHQCLVRS